MRLFAAQVESVSAVQAAQVSPPPTETYQELMLVPLLAQPAGNCLHVDDGLLRLADHTGRILLV